MKNILKLLAVPAAMFAAATPAFASDFTGPRVETGVVFNDTNVSKSDTQLNVGVGYDVALSPALRLGVDVTAAGPFTNNRELGISGRLGVAVTPNVLVYGKAGYANRELYNTKLDGFQYGGGAEVAVTDNLYVKGEYRRTNYENNVNGNAGLVSLGIRF